MKQKYDYDAVIIGAGISGLVCGCYLAKAGLKTLIVEKNHQVGGYCTSFVRKNYLFDSAAHYVGGVNKGIFSKIIKELDLTSSLKFNQYDPSDKIILPGVVVYIRAVPEDTIDGFKRSFPREKNNIERFFKFIIETKPLSLYKDTINISLKKMLDYFFKNKTLKSIFGIILLGNMGSPPSKISAFAASIFIREFLLDSGYHPVGGMQQFSNNILEKYRYWGGELLLLQQVTHINVNNSKVEGVTISSGRIVRSKFVASAVDTSQVFNSLISKKTKELRVIKNLKPTISFFSVYLGINTNAEEISKEISNIWHFSTLDIEECYKSIKSNTRKKKIPGIHLSFTRNKISTPKGDLNKDSIQIFAMASFETESFWLRNREEMSDKILIYAEKVLPRITKYIDLKIEATPWTFYKYTFNQKGAAFGWASTVKQVRTTSLPQVPSIKNLFLTGHWAMTGAGQGGITTVALSGRKAATRIVNSMRNLEF